ncbi:alanine/glycine:cation symporter family protein [Thiohalobacter thiocyanaticus]|uniref:Sodium:alanine symporter family protein n=1 Tax=Thiohalobacter thiocyanaticus TaxID=585455 RepID=A0A426QHS2_9GAMM|nr:sodium:alanine symporter family protein [Thiohalobacter thiocyanaticus]RRQ21293.1 sodium:alanine symporter family protein [Thiohalobacter thiocyanaticus]
MESYTNLLSQLSGIIWGPVMLILLVGTGVYLTLGLKFMPLRRLGYGLRMLWQGRKPGDETGDISPFNALMTAMSATVGTGNIAGVATAIAIGGPGAVFWMWVTAVVGMATKYGEAVLAVRYREVDSLGRQQGGPMYYIKNGLGRNWRWLAFLFALFGTVAAFGIGNTVQAHSVADALETNLNIPDWATGLILAGFTFAVLIGGVKRIGKVAGKLVPFMATAYIAAALLIILLEIDQVPTALFTIVSDAFTGTAAVGGFAGSTLMVAISLGVERGVFSNEAGLGSAPIAHAAAKTKNPVSQGVIGMLGTFIDTIVICTMTALVIILSGGWIESELNGSPLTSYAFGWGLPYVGEYIVTFGLILFAYTTLLGWSFYGERCAEYLFGPDIIAAYRALWIVCIPLGAVAELEPLWKTAGVLNGLMAIPNLIALLLLSPVIFRVTREYFGREA